MHDDDEELREHETEQRREHDAGRRLAEPAEHDGAEARLWRGFSERQARLAAALDHHRYRDSFAVLAELGPDVAAFFDRGGVMVMDPDPVLRENRLSLLQQIYEPFARIADFRLLGGAA